MTNKEMVDKWLLSRGMERTSGNGLDPVIPFFMLDIAWNMWAKTVHPLPVKFELKRLRNQFNETYRVFSSRFLSAFSLDESIEITDKMDEFEQYIANDLTITRVQVMNYLTELDYQHKMVCGSLMIVNILCQAAGILWKAVYRGLRSWESHGSEIDMLEKLSLKFMSGYHSSICKEAVDPNRCDPIVAAVYALCHKMTAWLNQEKELPENEPKMAILPQKSVSICNS